MYFGGGGLFFFLVLKQRKKENPQRRAGTFPDLHQTLTLTEDCQLLEVLGGLAEERWNWLCPETLSHLQKELKSLSAFGVREWGPKLPFSLLTGGNAQEAASHAQRYTKLEIIADEETSLENSW